MTTSVREERKVLTAVFADVVGSTALAERLDPEDVKLVVGEAVARIVGEVESLGGHVKDLAGDGVLAFFGAPTTREDDAERAVRCALRIVGEMEEYGREVRRGWGAEGFGVRVGAATGAVVVGEVGAGSRVEYAAFGDTVNVAARLQGAAAAGSVLVDDATRRAVEGLFAWGEPQELELKGKSEPVVAWPVAGIAADGRSPRGLPGVETRLVGRSRELALGREALEALHAGRGGVLVVSGDAGIGKSRLLDELRQLAEGVGSCWLEGRCVSYGESLPYWPFRDLLRGEWIGAGVEEPELRVRVGLRRRLEQLFGTPEGSSAKPATPGGSSRSPLATGRSQAEELYPYLGGLLEVALEHEAAARTSQLSPEALQWRTFEVVGQLFFRLAEEAPLVLAFEDLHWADATSVLLLEQLLSLAEDAPVLLVLSLRPERDHPAWGLREHAAREFPHLLREIDLGPLVDTDGELLAALVAPATLPTELERRVLDAADGNPFFLEELVRSLADVGALTRTNDGWRFDHAVEVEVPPTIEKAILARLDRLSEPARELVTAASALGRTFALPLLAGVLGELPEDALHELQRLGLLRQSRRWPQPEYRFRHALIQETAYRTLLGDQRTRLHRRAAEWLEARYSERDAEVLGLLAYHWLRAEDEEKAADYLLRAGDKARLEYALDESIEHYRELLPLLERRGERQEIALVLFKLALALHTSLRFGEANDAYRRAFEHWTSPEPRRATERLRVATSFLPNDIDPKSAIAWPNIQTCMQLFDRLVEAWPERTIVPSLAERWEISDDGLRYVFHLREGLAWSDGTPLTAHDVEFGIKRVLDPGSPGSSVAIYFALENGEETYLGQNTDWDAVGVRALDDRTVEFRLNAPAPYFMSVMNRPDSGPQPRHAIEGVAEGRVVNGAFEIAERTDERLVLRRRSGRAGNVAEVELYRSAIADALPEYERGDTDLILVRYTPRLADLMPGAVREGAVLGSPAWSAYIRFDHTHPVTGNLELRRALAHAVDRDALAAVCPANLVVATGGVVPPALQGHTPDIALRYDPDLARQCLANSGYEGPIELAGMMVWDDILGVIAGGWRDVFGDRVSVSSWSWLDEEARSVGARIQTAPIRITGWLPGYPDPEYYLRLLFQSTSRTNEGGFADLIFDELIEAARQERGDRGRLERFHEADRYAVAERVAVIPLVYGRSTAFVRPSVHGWWEFGKSSANFADLVVERPDR
ncbi:MAG TPA: ABC transporter substrate-binding protein [Gaiellaceae bacterium]|nr:ABC transporter substrate-binding protein [Gaiellaceae bacterium]